MRAYSRCSVSSFGPWKPTPGRSTCEEVSDLLGLPLARTVKCLLIHAQDRVHMLLVRGDHMGNEVKIGNLAGFAAGWRWATDTEIVDATGCRPGYLGPVGLPKDVPLIVDRAVAVMADFVCGANEADYHLRGVNFGRDLPEPQAADLRNVVAGDPSPDGKGRLQIVRGIEVGHVFALGDVYSRAMGATYLDAEGASHVIQMGCYGIGVTRVVAAAIEQNHDERGIVWPAAMAPFMVAIAPIGYDRSEIVRKEADRLHEALAAAGVDVLLDDRAERPGVMFADLELIGIPHRITIGERGLKEGVVEYQGRGDAAATKVPVADALSFIEQRIAS